jgi:hypothetical protein
MKSIYFITLFLSLFVIISCNNRDTASRRDSTVKYIKALNGETDTPENPLRFEDVVIVPLETNDDILIGNISNVIVTDTLIFISDWNDKLFVFGKDGKFKNMIGTKGRGPGEYVTIGTFFVDEFNSHVVIVDQMSFAFHYYETDGRFKSKKKFAQNIIEVLNMALMLDEGNLLLNYCLNQGSNTAINIFNMADNEITGKREYHHLSIADSYSMAVCKHPITKSETGADMIMPLCDTIFNCFSDGKIEHKYIVEHNRKTAPLEDHKLTFDKTFRSVEIKYVRDGFFIGFSDIFETKYHILLNYGLIPGYTSGYFIADKATMEGYYYSTSSYDVKSIGTPVETKEIKEITVMPFFKTKTTDGTHFISAVQPNQILALKGKINDKEDDSLTKLNAVIDNLDEEDNPVIFFYKLK